MRNITFIYCQEIKKACVIKFSHFGRWIGPTHEFVALLKRHDHSAFVLSLDLRFRWLNTQEWTLMIAPCLNLYCSSLHLLLKHHKFYLINLQVRYWIIYMRTQHSCLHWSRTTVKHKKVSDYSTLPHGVTVSLLWGTVTQACTGHSGWPTVGLRNQNCVWILMHIYDVHMLFKGFRFITQNAMYNFAIVELQS